MKVKMIFAEYDNISPKHGQTQTLYAQVFTLSLYFLKDLQKKQMYVLKIWMKWAIFFFSKTFF